MEIVTRVKIWKCSLALDECRRGEKLEQSLVELKWYLIMNLCPSQEKDP
jgi:hypothetical protein